MLNKRVPVLFEDRDYQVVEWLAREDGVSVGEWLRDAARTKVAKGRDDQIRQRQDKIEEIMKWRKKVGVRATKSEILEWIREGRKYEDRS